MSDKQNKEETPKNQESDTSFDIGSISSALSCEEGTNLIHSRVEETDSKKDISQQGKPESPQTQVLINDQLYNLCCPIESSDRVQQQPPQKPKHKPENDVQLQLEIEAPPQPKLAVPPQPEIEVPSQPEIEVQRQPKIEVKPPAKVDIGIQTIIKVEPEPIPQTRRLSKSEAKRLSSVSKDSGGSQSSRSSRDSSRELKIAQRIAKRLSKTGALVLKRRSEKPLPLKYKIAYVVYGLIVLGLAALLCGFWWLLHRIMFRK